MKNITQDKYVLGNSVTKQIKNVGEEIRLDLSLQLATNTLNAGVVSGIVTDSNGIPIPYALIKITSSTYEPLLHAVSDANGNYTFSSVPVGQTYNIFAIASGTKLNQGVQFTVSLYETVTRNFILVPDPDASLGVIAGTLNNSVTNLPVAGAVVTLFSVDAANVERILAVTYTNTFGQFTFRKVGRGNYSIKVAALGYISVKATTAITQRGQIVPITIAIAADPNTSRGTVSGIITDSNNQPINEADVILYSVDANSNMTPVAYVKTNVSGIYLFVNVPAGSYKVVSNQTEITSVDVTDPWISSPDFDAFSFGHKGTWNGLDFSAANGILSNGAALTLGDKFVGNLGGAQNGAVTLDITVPQAAKYTVRISYVAGDADKTLLIDVNGVSTSTTYTFTKTPGATAADAQTYTTSLFLNAGVNVIKFYNTTNPGPIIGKLVLIATQNTFSVASTSGTGTSTNTPIPGYVGAIGDTGGTLTLSVNAPVAGKYTLGIQHLNTTVRQLTLNVNGVVGTPLSIPTTASWTAADAQVFNTTVTLVKGNNSIILFNSPNAEGPWVGTLTFTQQLFFLGVEAESGALSGTASINSGYVTGINSSGGSLTISATVPIADDYDVLIKYVTSSSNTVVNVDINGVSTGETYTFAVNPIGAQTVDYKYTRWPLKAGANTIKLYVK